jgi:hypothetical protein
MSLLWKTNGELIETFTSPSILQRDAFKYSFTYTLYAENTDGDVIVIDRKALKEVVAPKNSHKITRMHVTHYGQLNSPMRLILNDQTNYVPGQPLLALSLLLNEDDPNRVVRMPAQFRTYSSNTPDNRQIQMILPVVSSLGFEFDYRVMGF